MSLMIGAGLYAAGIALGPTTAALVIVEKRPRQTAPGEWEDDLVLVWHEQLRGRITEVARGIAERLNEPRLADECSAYVDITELGLPARRLLADHGAYAVPMVLGGTEEKRDPVTGVVTVPLRSLQARVTLALESGRLVVLERLSNGSAILRGLEDLAALPVIGPHRDLTLGATLAVWAAARHATGGPWASRQPPPRGSPDWLRLREIELEAEAEQRARARSESEWWDMDQAVEEAGT